MRNKTVIGAPTVESGFKERKKPGKIKLERPFCLRPGCHNHIKSLKSTYCSMACYGAAKRGNATREEGSVARGIATKKRNREISLNANLPS